MGISSLMPIVSGSRMPIVCELPSTNTLYYYIIAGRTKLDVHLNLSPGSTIRPAQPTRRRWTLMCIVPAPRRTQLLRAQARASLFFLHVTTRLACSSPRVAFQLSVHLPFVVSTVTVPSTSVTGESLRQPTSSQSRFPLSLTTVSLKCTPPPCTSTGQWPL